MITRKSILIVSLLVVFTALSCKREPEPVPAPAKSIDEEMYELATNTAGFIWYKHSDALLPKSSGSGHNAPSLRTRYNATAATMLDVNGKVQTGAVFPEGSLIVKELVDGSTTKRYAILLKRGGHEAADARGWVWGYLNADGSVAEPAANKGNICTGCHSQDGSIDYMLMNKFFP